MTTDLTALKQRLRTIESDIEQELSRRRAAFRYSVVNKRIVFEQDIARRHRQMKESLARYVLEAKPIHILTAPVIYALVVSFALLDLFVSVYQALCFRVWGIPRVTRGEYMNFDSMRLGYLNALEKLNCAYCAYGNGVIAYVREVAARTEQYWCPIKHARARTAAHERYFDFTDFGDADAYRGSLDRLRDDLKRPPDTLDLSG